MMKHGGVIHLAIECWHKILSVGNFAGKILMTAVYQPSQSHESKRKIKNKNYRGNMNVSWQPVMFLCVQ